MRYTETVIKKCDKTHNIKYMNLLQIDIYENEIFELSPELLSMLLIDRTLSSENCQVNIFWATNNYANFINIAIKLHWRLLLAKMEM